MELLSEETALNLYEEARMASELAYAPFSSFQVGAAVLTNDGRIFRGTNVENVSYGLTICAERIALGNTVSSGTMEVKAIAIYTKYGSAAPCGACRQFIYEFGKDILVIFSKDDVLVQMPIHELLPYAFDKTALHKKA